MPWVVLLPLVALHLPNGVRQHRKDGFQALTYSIGVSRKVQNLAHGQQDANRADRNERTLSENNPGRGHQAVQIAVMLAGVSKAMQKQRPHVSSGGNASAA